jgi:hypothetical protein
MVQLVIPARFNGPPASGNGGYTCGRVAALADGAGTRVVLRRPPPLDRPLRVDHDGESVTVFDGEDPVATADPASLRLDLPPQVTFAEAQRASQEYPGFRVHTFPTCFVCGPSRAAGDGLRLFAGPHDGVFAAPWTPHESLAGAEGLVAPEFVWASLDCPGAIAVGWPERGETVLGTLEATVRSQPLPGERCVVVAWPLGEEGRKLHAGTVLFGEDGEPHAYARAIWIAPR